MILNYSNEILNLGNALSVKSKDELCTVNSKYGTYVQLIRISNYFDINFLTIEFKKFL